MSPLVNGGAGQLLAAKASGTGPPPTEATGTTCCTKQCVICCFVKHLVHYEEVVFESKEFNVFEFCLSTSDVVGLRMHTFSDKS